MAQMYLYCSLLVLVFSGLIVNFLSIRYLHGKDLCHIYA